MRTCAITGKGTRNGKRGVHAHSIAWKMRAPSTKRTWQPNLHSVKVNIEGTAKRIKVSTKGLRLLKENNNELSRAQAKALGIM
jgi:large subunit ribosomal protein L28